jgi:hypothetical protein
MSAVSKLARENIQDVQPTDDALARLIRWVIENRIEVNSEKEQASSPFCAAEEAAG